MYLEGIGMVNWIFFIIILFLTIVNFYKNRHTFKQLTANEWAQYIIGLIVSVGVAVGIILIGKWMTNSISIGGVKVTIQIVIILVALLIAGFIFNKTIPEKIRELYN